MYVITSNVLMIVEKLIVAGYQGTATITNRFPAGISGKLEGCFAVELTGFCKESYYLTGRGDNDTIHVFGRYQEELNTTHLTVDRLIQEAWGKYQIYRSRGYSLPTEFESLFEKHGFIRYITKTVIEEVK